HHLRCGGGCLSALLYNPLRLVWSGDSI
ncbi:hypothetical protein A2U01_0090300, partial [Trifolium medium]|nr:hypothetical protein [Trifolium medium]